MRSSRPSGLKTVLLPEHIQSRESLPLVGNIPDEFNATVLMYTLAWTHELQQVPPYIVMALI